MGHVANVMISVEPDDRLAAEELSQWSQTSALRRGFGPGAVGWVGHSTRPPAATRVGVAASTRNATSMPERSTTPTMAGLVAHVEHIVGKHPEFLQLFVMDQEQVYFCVWMFHGAKLRQIAPEGREGEVWPNG
ncbi:hypothetical protein [Streptomyces sp. IBSNAI001]|uniref:hypothetical protein n=1 Tax=Streptomyces sp. IBSNAI001 TaxID=3457499 RepID=UPI003FD5B6CD